MSELVISVKKNDSRLAVLENGKLIDYQIESKNGEFVVGDIFLGEVKKKPSGLSAFFVNLDSEKDGFLHFDDLSENAKKKYIKISNFDYQPIDLSKDEKVTEAVNNIKIGQKVLVQVFKEPIFNKGPRLTTRITLAGKYLVLIPFNNEVCISKKIEDEKKREKLSDLVYAIKNNLHLNNFGFILRTSAENLFIREKDEKKIEKIFVEDLIKLLEKWSEGLKNLEKAKIGTRIMQGDNRIFTIVKDYLSETFDSIIIDDKEIYEQIKEDFGDEYFKDKSLKLYKNDTKTLFYYKQIDKQLKLLLNKTVKIEKGGYLIIEKTEAMNVIDVNSGACDFEADDHEEMVFLTNMNATKEIVRQIFLRDMGGIISIDFIDMEDQKHRIKIYETMKELMMGDKSSSYILPLSRFNVMQITRQRIRPVLNIDNDEKCPMCKGTGNVEPVIQTAFDVEDKIKCFLKNTNCYYLTIYLNPLLVAFFTNGFFSKRFKFGWKYWKSISIKPDYSFGLNSIKITNRKKIIFEEN